MSASVHSWICDRSMWRVRFAVQSHMQFSIWVCYFVTFTLLTYAVYDCRLLMEALEGCSQLCVHACGVCCCVFISVCWSRLSRRADGIVRGLYPGFVSSVQGIIVYRYDPVTAAVFPQYLVTRRIRSLFWKAKPVNTLSKACFQDRPDP